VNDMTPQQKVLAKFPGAKVVWTDNDFAPCTIESASGEMLGFGQSEKKAWIDAAAIC